MINYNLKYRRWYDQLIDRATRRVLDEYAERHHIIPTALGGPNDSGNIVSLTFREHFLAHLLLIQFTTGQARRKMQHALQAMSRARSGRIVASWQYEAARTAQRTAMFGNKNLFGYVPTDETRRRLSVAGRRRPHIDLVGMRFGRWTVLSQNGRTHDHKLAWLCKCVCGSERLLAGNTLKMGSSKSCGCLRRELMQRPRGPMNDATKAAISASKKGLQSWQVNV